MNCSPRTSQKNAGYLEGRSEVLFQLAVRELQPLESEVSRPNLRTTAVNKWKNLEGKKRTRSRVIDNDVCNGDKCGTDKRQRVDSSSESCENLSTRNESSISPGPDLSGDDEKSLHMLKNVSVSPRRRKTNVDGKASTDKRTEISLADRMAVIDFAEHFSERETARVFGISKSTVNAIKKNKLELATLYEASKNTGASRCRRIRRTSLEDVNNATWKWFLERTQMKECITNKDLQEKAISYAKKAGVGNFTASNGWLHSFKKRFGIVLSRSVVSVKNAKSVSAYLEAKKVVDPRSPEIVDVFLTDEDDDWSTEVFLDMEMGEQEELPSPQGNRGCSTGRAGSRACSLSSSPQITPDASRPCLPSPARITILPANVNVSGQLQRKLQLSVQLTQEPVKHLPTQQPKLTFQQLWREKPAEFIKTPEDNKCLEVFMLLQEMLNASLLSERYFDEVQCLLSIASDWLDLPPSTKDLVYNRARVLAATAINGPERDNFS